jgi:site-specific recombinase XerD
MDLIDAYLSTLSSKQTRRAYRTDLQAFFAQKDRVDAQSLRGIKGEHIQVFVRTMQDRGRSGGTQRRRLAALRSFFDWAITEGIHDRNPARHPAISPIVLEDSTSSVRRLSQTETRQLLEAAGRSDATGLRDRAIVLVTVVAALRRSEVAQVQVQDIRPLGRYWILDLSPDSSDGDYVRIPETVVGMVEEVQETYGISSGPLWRSVSNRNRGEPLTPDAIYSIVRRAGSAADVGPVSIDTLRRTGLHLAAEGGADVAQIQAHGRYGSVASAARVPERADRKGTKLRDGAAAYIELDALGVQGNN